MQKKYLTVMHKDFYASLSFEDYGYYEDGVLNISIPSKRLLKYKVKKSDFYCKAMKKYVNASGGIDGLYRAFKDCLDNNYGIEMLVIEPLKNIIENTKTIKME